MLESINVFGELEKILIDTFNNSIPIGYIYVQYPNQKSPVELYNNDKIQSVWEEQLQYNSAFFRSNKPSTELWTPDNGIHFYKESNKDYPVNISGITGGRSSGVTYYNQDEGITYTKWSGWNRGSENEFNNTIQTNQNKYHIHENRVSLTQPTIGPTPMALSASFYFRSRDCSGVGPQGEVEEGGYYYANDPQGVSITITDIGNTGSYNRSANKSVGGGFHDMDYVYVTPHVHTFNRTRNFTVSITNANEGGNEFRPDNYTIRIWKRIA